MLNCATLLGTKYDFLSRVSARRRMTVYDFDRLESDDVLGNLELDMWKVFDKNWAQEVEKSWPFNDDYGAVDHKLVQKASADKEHVCFVSLALGSGAASVSELTHIRVMMLACSCMALSVCD